MADLKDLKGALVFAMKFETAQQATRKDRHPIRAVNEDRTSNSSVERLERRRVEKHFLNRVESLMSQKAGGEEGHVNAGPAVEKRELQRSLPGLER
ncbi:hypothetical protein TNCV_4356021 [Trichonephila clavipes]|nr:hypothetical protein TNCV_4356021 [Trichonephila clavipes]